MIRLNPKTSGLEGFFERSLHYLKLFNEEFNEMEKDGADVEDMMILLSVIQDINIRLSLVFGNQWYGELNDYD